MSTLQRILNKRKEGEDHARAALPQTQQAPVQQQESFQPENRNTSPSMDSTIYNELANNNPHTFQFTSQLFPASTEAYEKSKFAYGVFFPPYPQPLIPVETRSDKIPRCIGCRAYMNLYNRFATNGSNFICAFCNKQNTLATEYHCRVENGDRVDRYERGELHLPVYSSNPPDIYYNEAPPETTFVFMVDVSSASYHSQMLFYFVNAVKQVLNNPDYDDYLIFFYTFDEHVHDYNLSGDAPQRKIIDDFIDDSPSSLQNRDLATCRNNLWFVLDSLQQISKTNDKQKSNFAKAFNYVFESTKNYSPKIFICQSNQTFSSQQIAIEKENKGKPDPLIKKSKLESSNVLFYNKYISHMITKNVSVAFFCFAKQFRNIQIFSDSFKLTNSEAFYYQKDSKEETMKFYYDLYNLLSIKYLQEYKTQFIVSQGWSVSATYSNMYRQQKTLLCKVNNLSDQKYIALTFSMAPNISNSPYFLLQTISNYSLGRSRRITISTVIKSTSNQLPQIYANIDHNCLVAMNFRIGLSMLRMEQSLAIRNDFIKRTAHFYLTAKAIYKDKMPAQVISVIQGSLAFIKSYHCHIENYSKTALMDRIIAERNLLQCCGSDELSTYFVPYLFSVSKMTEDDCTNTEEGFNYPPTVPLAFNSVSSGIFVMDCSVHIYLFIAKFHDTQQLHQLFGVQKISKDLVLTEQEIQNQGTPLANKIMQLLNQIRLRKSYGYIPLYVVKCGEGSARQMGFYLNFCNEKYQEFKNYHMNLNQFIELLHTQVATNSYT